MRFWLLWATVVVVSSFSTALLAYFGPPYSPLSSLTGLNSYARRVDLSLIKSAVPPHVGQGQEFTYLLTVTNNSSADATSVIVTDPLPTGVAFGTATTSQGTCEESSGTVICRLGNIAKGAGATVTIKVTPLVVGPISNTATVSASEPDAKPGDNANSVDITVEPPGVCKGTVILQGRPKDKRAGTEITLFRDGVQQGSPFITPADGSFSFNLEPGSHWVQAKHAGWLSQAVECTSGFDNTTGLEIKLLAGDANSNDHINSEDLRLFQQALGHPANLDTQTNISGDTLTDVLDLGYPSMNLGAFGCPTEYAGDAGAPRILQVQHLMQQDPINSLIFDFNVVVESPAQVWVEYQQANGKGVRLKTALSQPMTTNHHLSVLRLRPNTKYCYWVFAVDEQGKRSRGVLGTFRSGALPAGLADSSFTLVKGPTTYPLTLIEHVVPNFHGIVALDSEAQVVWYHSAVQGRVGALVQDKSTWHLLYESGNIIREVTPLEELVAESSDVFCHPEPDPLNRDGVHHEVLAPRDGKVLYLGRVIKNPFNNPNRLQQGDTIRQWDQPTGNDIEVWDPFNFLNPARDRTSSSDASAASFWSGCDGRLKSEDWTHSNSIQRGPRGNIIMSIRHLNQIISIKPDFSGLEWRLGDAGQIEGHTPGDFSFPNPNDRFYHQHSATELPNGNILLFDNGNLRPAAEGGQYSRGLELALNFETKTATKVWEYRHENRHTTDPSDFLYSAAVSNVTRLGNGNTVVMFGGDYGTDVCCRVFTLVEANGEGKAVAVIEISSPGKGSQYRAYPVYSIYGESEK